MDHKFSEIQNTHSIDVHDGESMHIACLSFDAILVFASIMSCNTIVYEFLASNEQFCKG